MPPRPQVLLIDDDPSFLRATTLALSEKYRITCLEDAREALHHFPTADVIVCDFKMQHLNGHEILSRAGSRSRPLPVILVSAYASKEMAIAAANLHVFAILEKPLDINELQALIEQACHKKATSPPPKVSDITLCSSMLSATTDGSPAIRLTVTEFRILEIFLNSPNIPILRDSLIQEVWGYCKLTENVLDTHLGNLKRKIPLFSKRLKLIRGRGYIYAE